MEEFLKKKKTMIKTSNNLVEQCTIKLSMVRNQKQELIEKMSNEINIEEILRCIYDELYYESLLKDICDINQTISQLTC